MDTNHTNKQIHSIKTMNKFCIDFVLLRKHREDGFPARAYLNKKKERKETFNL